MYITVITGLWVSILIFLTIRFIRILFKMRQTVVFPLTEVEWNSILVHPNKTVGKPDLSHQKMAVWGNGLVIFFITLWIVVETLLLKRHFPAAIVFAPILWNLPKLWNLFAFLKQGIVCGNRFVPWNRLQSYQFIPIDKHHRYYGYSPKLNEGYELLIHTKFSEVSCLVTTESVKQKLILLLEEQLKIHQTRPIGM